MYLDPSFGGMLFQIIIALIAGGGAIVFGMRRKIISLFKRKKDTAVNINQQSPSDGQVIDMLADEEKKEK